MPQKPTHLHNQSIQPKALAMPLITELLGASAACIYAVYALTINWLLLFIAFYDPCSYLSVLALKILMIYVNQN